MNTLPYFNAKEATFRPTGGKIFEIGMVEAKTTRKSVTPQQKKENMSKRG